jgi:nicotinamide-nucleotide amidase
MVGDELTGGSVQDINASFTARELDMIGWDVSAIMLVGDDPPSIISGLDYLFSRSDVVIVSGGLGPTADDITTAAIAEGLGLPLETDEKVLARLKERFHAYNIPWTENNAKQARFPRGSTIIDNPVGTAAGFYARTEKGAVIVVPGVPRELQRMIPGGVAPVLEREFNGERTIKARRTLKITGLSESRVDEIIAGIGPFPDISLGFYPHFPEQHLVVIARGRDADEAAARLEDADKRIRRALDGHVYGVDGETLEKIVGGLLEERGLTLAVAESFTGGLIADRLTDIPGISRFLERGIVAYSNDAKVELLKVPADVIEKHGAVSRETAEYMARGVKTSSGVDLGLSTTGIAGPAGGSDEKPVGTVYIALAAPDGIFCRKLSLRWGRRGIKEIGAQTALDMARRYLTGGAVCDE